MPTKAKTLYIAGVSYAVEVEEFRSGDGEGTGSWGYIENHERRIAVDENHQDDNTLAHEAGHAIADQRGVYLSEHAMAVWEELFSVCRDPRNKWFVDYLAGGE